MNMKRGSSRLVFGVWGIVSLVHRNPNPNRNLSSHPFDFFAMMDMKTWVRVFLPRKAKIHENRLWEAALPSGF